MCGYPGAAVSPPSSCRLLDDSILYRLIKTRTVRVINRCGNPRQISHLRIGDKDSGKRPARVLLDDVGDAAARSVEHEMIRLASTGVVKRDYPISCDFEV